MDALDAGQAAGGDTRGMQSAGLLVVRPVKPGSNDVNERIVDLRVDDTVDPFKELRRLLNINLGTPRAFTDQSAELAKAGKFDEALLHLQLPRIADVHTGSMGARHRLQHINDSDNEALVRLGKRLQSLCVSHGFRRKTALVKTLALGHSRKLFDGDYEYLCHLHEYEHRNSTLTEFVGEHRLLRDAYGPCEFGLSHSAMLAQLSDVRTQCLEVGTTLASDRCLCHSSLHTLEFSLRFLRTSIGFHQALADLAAALMAARRASCSSKSGRIPASKSLS